MIYDWPRNLVPQGTSFNKRGQTVNGPPSLTGRTQVGSTDAGYWVANLRSIVVTKKEQIKAFRALRALLEGGAHQIRVPVFDCFTAPWPLDVAGRAVAKIGPVRFSDGSVFSDGSTFWQPAISAKTVGDAAQRSTRIVLDFARVGTLQGGESFSIGDRLYEVKAVLGVSGSQQTLAISPTLREAVPAGTPVNFDRPVCRMRLVEESSMDMALEFGRRAFPEIAFVEVFDG